MSDAIKIWTAEEDLLNTDLNAEFSHVYASITAQSVGAASSVTPDLLSDGANPEVFFAELFKDGRVLTPALGLAFLSSSGLSVTISAGTAYILQTSTDPDQLVRVNVPSSTVVTMSPSTTNFVDLDSSGIFTVTSATVPAADSTRLMSVVTDATMVTANTDLADREFPENNPLFPFQHSNLVVDVSTTTTVTLESGSVFRDDTNVSTITTTSDLTADITATVGLNALDQGTESSNTWYAFLHLSDPTGALPEGTLLVDEADYPASIILPSGYTDALIRRVGWVRNDSSSDFLLGTQVGSTFQFDDEQTISSSFTSASFTDISTSSFTSPSSRIAHINSDSGDSGGSTAGQTLFYTRAGITAATGGVTVITTRAGSEVFDDSRQVSVFSVPIDDASTRDVAFRSPVTIAFIAVNGYEDALAD